MIWLYGETRDSEKLATHAFGTFWYVLPSLPMFLVMPWMLRKGINFPCFLGYRYCSYDPPYSAYDPNFGQIRNESLRSYSLVSGYHSSVVEGQDGNIDDSKLPHGTMDATRFNQNNVLQVSMGLGRHQVPRFRILLAHDKSQRSFCVNEPDCHLISQPDERRRWGYLVGRRLALPARKGRVQKESL